jgi:hypothetical protein
MWWSGPGGHGDVMCDNFVTHEVGVEHAEGDSGRC